MHIANRVGNELLTQITEHLSDCVTSVQHTPNTIDYSTALQLVQQTIVRRKRCVIACSVILSNILPAPVQTRLFQYAYAIDPLQTLCVEYLYTKDISSNSIAFPKLFIEEVSTIAKKMHLWNVVQYLPEIQNPNWSVAQIKQYLENFIGPLGLTKGTLQTQNLSMIATEWRHEWIRYWIFRRLLQEDRKNGNTRGFDALFEVHPIYTWVMSATEGRPRDLDKALVQVNSELCTRFIAYRFAVKNADRDNALGELYQILLEQCVFRYRKLTEDEQSEWIAKILVYNYRVLPAIGYSYPPNAWIFSVFKSKYYEILRDRTSTNLETTEEETFFHQIEFSDTDDIVEDLHQQKCLEQFLSVQKELLQQIDSVKNRLAYLFVFSAYSDYHDFIDDIVATYGDSPQRVQHKIDEFIENQEMVDALITSDAYNQMSEEEKHVLLQDCQQKQAQERKVIISRILCDAGSAKSISWESIERSARRGRDKFQTVVKAWQENL